MRFSELKSDMICLRSVKRNWPVYYYIMEKRESTIDYATLINMDNLWILRIRYNETEADLIHKSVQLIYGNCQEYNKNYRRDMLKILLSYRVDIYMGSRK